MMSSIVTKARRAAVLVGTIAMLHAAQVSSGSSSRMVLVSGKKSRGGGGCGVQGLAPAGCPRPREPAASGPSRSARCGRCRPRRPGCAVPDAADGLGDLAQVVGQFHRLDLGPGRHHLRPPCGRGTSPPPRSCRGSASSNLPSSFASSHDAEQFVLDGLGLVAVGLAREALHRLIHRAPAGGTAPRHVRHAQQGRPCVHRRLPRAWPPPWAAPC